MSPVACAPYVSGVVTIPAGIIVNLLSLIQQQLAPNAPPSGAELQIAADPANAGSIRVGSASAIGGPLSLTNYAYALTPTSPPRLYRSVYPGQSVPVGEIQLLSAAGGNLLVELWT